MAEIATTPALSFALPNYAASLNHTYQIPEFRPIVPPAPIYPDYGAIGKAFSDSFDAAQRRRDTEPQRLLASDLARMARQGLAPDPTVDPNSPEASGDYSGTAAPAAQPGNIFSKALSTVGNLFTGKLGQAQPVAPTESAPDSVNGAREVTPPTDGPVTPANPTGAPLPSPAALARAALVSKLNDYANAGLSINAQGGVGYTSKPSLSPEQADLIRAQIANDNARTEYERQKAAAELRRLQPPQYVPNQQQQQQQGAPSMPTGGPLGDAGAQSDPGNPLFPGAVTQRVRTTSFGGPNETTPDSDTQAGRAATGKLIPSTSTQAGSAAIDPNLYPFGTIFKTADGRVYVGNDVGGAVSARRASKDGSPVVDLYRDENHPDYQNVTIIPPLVSNYASLSEKDKQAYHQMAAAKFGQGQVAAGPSMSLAGSPATSFNSAPLAALASLSAPPDNSAPDTTAEIAAAPMNLVGQAGGERAAAGQPTLTLAPNNVPALSTVPVPALPAPVVREAAKPALAALVASPTGMQSPQAQGTNLQSYAGREQERFLPSLDANGRVQYDAQGFPMGVADPNGIMVRDKPIAPQWYETTDANGNRVRTFASPQVGQTVPTNEIPANIKQELEMRKEFEAKKEIAEYKAATTAYNALQNLASKPNRNTADDFAIIREYAKISNPGSIVREATFAKDAAAGNYGDVVKNAMAHYIGDNALQPGQVDHFIDSATQVVKAQQDAYHQAHDEMAEQMARYGLDPQRALPAKRNVFAPYEAKAAAAASAKAAAAASATTPATPVAPTTPATQVPPSNSPVPAGRIVRQGGKRYQLLPDGTAKELP